MSFSLRTLLLALSYTGLLLASLLAPSVIWAELVILATYLIVLLATIGALFGPRDTKAFRGGFALAATSILALTVYPGRFAGFPTERLSDELDGLLQGTRERLWITAEERKAAPTGMPGGITDGIQWTEQRGKDGTLYSTRFYVLQRDVRRFLPVIGNCVLALVVGLIGAFAAKRAARGDPQSAG